MDLTLVRVHPGHGKTPTSDFGGLPATAWTDGEGTISIRPPFDAMLFPIARVLHEAEHNLCDDFASNADHHPWWHFCGRVAHAMRLSTRHLRTPRWVAQALLRDGKVVGLTRYTERGLLASVEG